MRNNRFFTNNHKDYQGKNIGDFTYGAPMLMTGSQLIHLAHCVNVVSHLGGGGHPRAKGPVVIGNDVWIGYGATILSGVTIGDGAAIGARSCVAKDVPAYTIAAGNPAREIRKRFDETIIRDLLELKWWDAPLEIIEPCIEVMLSDRIELFIKLMSYIKTIRPW